MGSSSSSMGSYPGQRPSGASGPQRMQQNQAYVDRLNQQQNASSTTTASTQPSSSTSNPPSSTPSANTISRPGAYSIARNSNSNSEVFRVQIPTNVRPGGDFQVYAGSRIVRVRCPPNARPGQNVQITLPPEDVVTRTSLNIAVLTSPDENVGGGNVRMNSTTRLLNANATTSTNPASNSQPPPIQEEPQVQQQVQAYNVRVPAHARPGRPFSVIVDGRTIQVNCPVNARPGMTVQIRLPPPRTGPPPGMQSATNLNRPPSTTPQPNQPAPPRTRTIQQMFEVTVPPGVRPNQPFSIMAGGQRVLVSCPVDARPGSRIRFELPVSVPDTSTGSSSSSAPPVSKGLGQGVALKYDTQDGWIRTVRVTDMKFTWIKMDDNGDIVSSNRNLNNVAFDVENSAFVRNLQFMEGNDKRMRTGKVTLVPASEYSVDANIYDEQKKKKLVDMAELSKVQTQSFESKTTWFLQTCKKLGVPWEEGHMRIAVRRDELLSDSINAVMSLGREDLRKIWRFDFMGEMGIDAGGLAKEWYLLVTKAIFDADSGLWLSSEGNQMLMRINPSSEVSCPEDHLIYFRFLGRVLGKALFEGQIVAGHMVQYLYKYMLGWPITFGDLESIDVELYENLKKILVMDPNEIEYMCLDFTTTQNLLGETTQIQLVPNGEDKAVTGENLPEYLQVYFKYLMLERIRPQVTELLLGFYDVIPEPLLTIFDFQELELMMCGLPTIDMKDWMNHTQYGGSFERMKERNQVCKWFWEIVKNDFDQEMRARLLQFVTGTSGVPSRGFSVLQGSDGNIKLFTLNGDDNMPVGSYPRSHTCFNRLDLPNYRSKKDLKEKLKVAVKECATGFTIE